MPWRNSPFFERQLAAITPEADASVQEFVAEILSSTTDDSLLVFADWLEERGDARTQYIRDMCALAAGNRPLDALVDRVNDFEDTLETGDLVYCRTINECWLFSLTSQKILAQEQIDAMRQTLGNLIENPGNQRKVVLDMGRVQFMGSGFLGTLITLHRSLHQQEGQLCLCRLNPALMELFAITRLDRLFPVHGSVDEAVP